MDAGPALLGNSTWGRADSLARLCQLMDLVHETIFVSPAAAWRCLLLSTTHLCQPRHSTEQAPSCLQDEGPGLFLSAVWTLRKGRNTSILLHFGEKNKPRDNQLNMSLYMKKDSTDLPQHIPPTTNKAVQERLGSTGSWHWAGEGSGDIQ